MSSPWMMAGEWSLSITGACWDGHAILGGVLIPVGWAPELEAQPVHPLPFSCLRHLCSIKNSGYVIRAGDNYIAFPWDQSSILGGGVLCMGNLKSGQALSQMLGPDLMVHVMFNFNG